jgi:hypothetical protein
MEVSGELHARPLCPRGKNPRYTFNRRLGGLYSWSGRCYVDENTYGLAGNGTPVINPVTSHSTTKKLHSTLSNLWN